MRPNCHSDRRGRAIVTVRFEDNVSKFRQAIEKPYFISFRQKHMLLKNPPCGADFEQPTWAGFAD